MQAVNIKACDGRLILRRGLLIFWVSICLGGCGAMIVGGAPGGTPGYGDERTSSQISADAAITSAVNGSFVRDELVNALDIRVTTYLGVVTLRGSVSSRTAATRAIELAQGTRNVKRVVSRLTVVR